MSARLTIPILLALLLSGSARAQLSDPAACLAPAPAPVDCHETAKLCDEVGTHAFDHVLATMQDSRAIADALVIDLATHPDCRPGARFATFADRALHHHDRALDEIDTIYARVLAPPYHGTPSYALAGHIEGATRRAMLQIDHATYQASLAAGYCKNPLAVEVMEASQLAAVQLNELYLRASRCYVSAYLGRSPTTGRCE